MKILSASSLSYEDIKNLTTLCAISKNCESSSLSFPLSEDELVEPWKYYLLYENNILTSALARIRLNDELFECIGFTHPDYRRQGRFSSLLFTAAEELSDEEHLVLLVDNNSISSIKALDALECEYWYSEYMMEIQKSALNVSTNNDSEYSKISIKKVISKADANDTVLYQCLLNQQIIGSCHLAHHDNAHYLYHFKIQAAYQNRGYGRHFLKLLCQQLFKNENDMPLTLQVNSQNENACHLYQSFGFNITTELKYYLW